jgi:translation initiation factor 2B subunit (eIF-2B alpha/beta/delta family)
MGTYPLACLAEKFNIPLYCITSTNKLIPFNYQMPEEQEKRSSEIMGENRFHVKIINYYFDTTPTDLISGFITEQGLISNKEIKKIIKDKELHPLLK